MWDRLSKWTVRVAKGGWKEEIQQGSDSHLFSGVSLQPHPPQPPSTLKFISLTFIAQDPDNKRDQLCA